MSFVHPLSAMGQPLREEGPPSLRELAAASVAQTMAQGGRRALQEFQELEDLKGGLNGAFQLARADAIAQQAAEIKKNRADQEFITAYEGVMFAKTRTRGPRNEKGMTAQMRTRKRLMQPDLSDLYYAKKQRRVDRNNVGPEYLPVALTPEEVRAQPHLPLGTDGEFGAHVAGYLGFDEPQVQRKYGWEFDLRPDMEDHVGCGGPAARTCRTTQRRRW